MLRPAHAQGSLATALIGVAGRALYSATVQPGDFAPALVAHALAYATAEERDEFASDLRISWRVLAAFGLGLLLGPLIDALALLRRRWRCALVRWLLLPPA